MPCFVSPTLSKFPPRAGTSHRLESLHQLLQRVLMLLLVIAGLLLAPRAQALGTITGLRVQKNSCRAHCKHLFILSLLSL